MIADLTHRQRPRSRS